MVSRTARKVTLKDVAARAGVTPAAVSMALSGHARISDSTAERVKRIAAELGYVPSSAGRALQSRKSGAIALIVPNSARHVFGHNYFMHVLNGVTESANTHGVSLIVSTGAADVDDGITAYERVLRSGRVDGAVVTSSAIADPNVQSLAQTGLPVVLIGNDPTLTGCFNTWIDDVSAAAAMTSHLLDYHGLTRVAHVTGPLDHQAARDRREGFLNAVAALGGSGRCPIIEGDFSEASGYKAAEEFRAAPELPEAIFCANDDMAFGCLTALREAGIRVPEDVAIVGFDDFGGSRWSWPGITTMRVPVEQLAQIAAEEVFRQLAGAEPATPVQLEPTFVARESCGCRRAPAPLPSE